MTEQSISSDTPKFSLDEILERLQASYASRGWSRQLWINDSCLLKRIGHPQMATLRDLEAEITRTGKQSTRATYVARIKSLWRHMRRLGLIDSRVDEELPDVRKPRSVPRPLSDAQVDLLLGNADQPFRDWFTLGCYAGLRAMEVSGVRGSDLEDGPVRADGSPTWGLRVRGKGGTDLVVPAAPQVVAVVQSYRTLGRLWDLGPRKVSTYACREMRRLGVERRFHDCRHWYATTLLEVTGGDLPTVAELMRHGSIMTTRGYTALNVGRQREAVLNLPDFSGGGGARSLTRLDPVGASP